MIRDGIVDKAVGNPQGLSNRGDSPGEHRPATYAVVYAFLSIHGVQTILDVYSLTGTYPHRIYLSNRIIWRNHVGRLPR
jgi:hypothetical protein